MEILTIYFSAVDDAQFKVIARSQVGQAEADSRLPFFETAQRWRTTLIKALGVNEFSCSAFSRQGEQEWMVAQGLLSSDKESFHPAMLTRIGEAMYESLFPVGGVRDVLQRAIAIAEYNSTQLHIQLEFDAEITKRSRLPDYPWELAHDGQKFLAHHQVRFSRHINYMATIPNLPPVKQLNVLLVSSAASDGKNNLMPLSKKEQKAVLNGLKKARIEGHIHLDILEEASLKQLRTYLTEHQGNQIPHIFHFDGHGFFGRRCNVSSCRTIHGDLATEKCQKCGAALPKPQGYLLFETSEDEPDYVSAIELGELLEKTSFGDDSNQRRGGVVVAVLSACKSGMALGGESVFNGVAQQLIYHRIPAVVAMQYNVRVDAATQFTEQFYRSLGCKNSLVTAISQAQEAMGGGEGNQWYRPVLYLRWEDNEGGQLFKDPGIPLNPEVGAKHLGDNSSGEPNVLNPNASPFQDLQTNHNPPVNYPENKPPSTILMLNNEEKKKLREALISAFPTEPDLEMMLADELDISLNTIAGGKDYTQIVRNVVNWFDSQGRSQDLIQAASRANSGNPKLKEFCRDIGLVDI